MKEVTKKILTSAAKIIMALIGVDWKTTSKTTVEEINEIKNYINEQKNEAARKTARGRKQPVHNHREPREVFPNNRKVQDDHKKLRKRRGGQGLDAS